MRFLRPFPVLFNTNNVLRSWSLHIMPKKVSPKCAPQTRQREWGPRSTCQTKHPPGNRRGECKTMCGCSIHLQRYNIDFSLFYVWTDAAASQQDTSSSMCVLLRRLWKFGRTRERYTPTNTHTHLQLVK